MHWLRKIGSYPLGWLGLLLLLAVVAFLEKYVTDYLRTHYSTCDSLFWFFSSSAQSIATFVAFLLTGYSLLLSIMDRLEEKDETLEDIHHNLKLSYYQEVRILLILTGAAIVCSLGMIFSHEANFSGKYQIILAVILLNASTVFFGILFVLDIIDPAKYRRMAQQIIDAKADGFTITGKMVNRVDFFVGFLELEKKVRTLWESHNEKTLETRSKAFSSFKEMCDSLLYQQQIDKDLHNKMIEVSRYRNLVFHGRIEEVDIGMMNLLEECVKMITELSKQRGIEM